MLNFSIGKIVILLLVAWLVVIILLSGPLFHGTEPDEQLLNRLTRAVGELEALKQQNEELHALLTSLKSPAVIDSRSRDMNKSPTNSDGIWNSGGPTMNFERTRRRIENGVLELWFYTKSEIKKLNRTTDKQLSKKLTSVLENIEEHKRTLDLDMSKLRDADGLKSWREAEAKELSDIVQNRLNWLQNPADCSKARKLVCSLNKGCGYGCQLHHVVYCLIVAYGTKRTLILQSSNWRYASKGWESVFQPLSKTCQDDSGSSRDSWPGRDTTQVLNLPIVDNVKPRPPYLPLDVPKDLSDRLFRLHGNPSVWWIGQFVKFLLRPQKELDDFLSDSRKKLGFQKPIVGVHVRRTDKIGTEAAFHKVDEYMDYVAEYYRGLSMMQSVDVKRVYLATDDSNVLEEAKKKYPDYVFIGDPNIAKSASVANRYSTASLKGVILDIQMLAETDYLVCTFSSQVCRVSYEIMQTLNTDASSWFHSLDDSFYFGGQKDHNQIALYDHSPSTGNNEIEMKGGDLVGIAGNHWDGFSKGINRRTQRSGLYPSFKVQDKIDPIIFPNYAEADKLRSKKTL